MYISARTLGQCMALAVRQYGDGFYISSDEMIPRRLKSCISQETRTGLYETSLLPAFEKYLAANTSRCYDWQSGREEELKNWVLSRPDNSITPLQIFQQSLYINRGNIWNALLAIHDLTRNNARWFDTTLYEYESSREQEEAFFNKMIDIRGDLRERGEGYTGDHFGSWYRPWLGMLLRLDIGSLYSEDWIAEAKSHAADFHHVSSWTDGLIDASTTMLSIKLLQSFSFNFIKLLSGKDVDAARKEEVTTAGIRAASWMIASLRQPGILKKAGMTNELCDERIYLQK